MGDAAVRYVWDSAILRARSSTKLIMAFRHDGSHLTVVPGADEMYVRGEPVPVGGLPDEMFILDVLRKQDAYSIPKILLAGGTVVVSPEVKAVMERFDLGESRFAPVRLRKSDRQTPFAGECFILNYACVKEGFEPAQSQNFKANTPGTSSIWLGTQTPQTQDDDFKVNASVLEGPDIWKDPRINRALFFSDRLMQALLAEGLFPDGFKRRRCVVLLDG